MACLDLVGLGGGGTMVVTDYSERIEELRFPAEYDVGREGENRIKDSSRLGGLTPGK